MKYLKLLGLCILIMLGINTINAYDYESIDYKNLYIHTKTLSELNETRQDLINWVWKRGHTQKTPTINTKSASTMPNFGSISTEYISTTYDYYYNDEVMSAQYHVYHIINNNPNNRLFIFNTGHGAGTETGSVSMVNDLLANGYDVVVTYMLGKGDNVGYTNHFWYDHSEPVNLNTDTYNPMELFFNHIWWTMEYIDSNYNYTDYSMTGISGGGWTTVLYSALDTRISNSYSVAGSYPRFIYDEVMPGAGDWEQGSFSDYVYYFYVNNVSYLDMYALSAINGRLINIHNQYDSCCFAGTHSNFYKSYVTYVAFMYGGYYNSFITDGTDHQYTTSARNLIISTNENIRTVEEKQNKNVIKVSVDATNNNINATIRRYIQYSSSTNNVINFNNLIWGDL